MTTTAPLTALLPTSSATIDYVPQTLTPSPLQSWQCHACDVSFDTTQAHADHVKCAWHIYNVKRQIAELQSVSLATFRDQVNSNSESCEDVNASTTQEIYPTLGEDKNLTQLCLFCHHRCQEGSDHVEELVRHMAVAHGFVIPNQNDLMDLESFVVYLAVVVREWHECLYCGTTRNSTPAVQSHMRDRSHCKLNLDREVELLEFWEDPNSTTPNGLDEGFAPDTATGTVYGNDLQLPSGKVVGSRAVSHKTTRTRKVKDSQLVLQPKPEQSTSASRSTSSKPGPSPGQTHHDLTLSRRDQMSLQNIGPQQRHALVLAQKRSQKEEAVETRAREWSYAKQANHQKNDQNHGPLSWAKGGLHSLLPR